MTLNDDVKRIVQAVSIQGADFLLVKDKYIFKRMSTMKLKAAKPMHLLLVKEFDVLLPMTEKEMRSLGYYHKRFVENRIIKFINWLRRIK